MKIESWTPGLEEIKDWATSEKISTGEPIRACGCGVKLDLEEVVYPVLRQTIEAGTSPGLGQRVDSAVFKGRLNNHSRVIQAIDGSHHFNFLNSIKSPAVIAALVSQTPQFYTDPKGTRNKFSKSVKIISDTISRASLDGKDVFFGKAHSIEGNGDFVLMDLFHFEKSSSINSHINNDTIITADSLVKFSSRISVFTAFNNALNDLFVQGVNENLEIFPVVDGNETELMEISRHVGAYEKYFADNFAPLKIHPLQKINRGTQLVGATVIGTAQHDVRGFSGLNEGDEILITRKLGDLSILALHRMLSIKNLDIPQKVKELRFQVLQRFMTAQFEIANILKRYYPQVGSDFDPEKHISFSTDLSGPGLAVLEEAARESQVDVRIDRLDFFDVSLLKHYRRNHTSSTNGPHLLAGKPSLIAQVKKDLEAIGLNELWKLGSVLAKSKAPTMIFDQKLKSLEDVQPRLDFFSPEVWFDNEKRRIPVFKRMRFE